MYCTYQKVSCGITVRYNYIHRRRSELYNCQELCEMVCIYMQKADVGMLEEGI